MRAAPALFFFILVVRMEMKTAAQGGGGGDVSAGGFCDPEPDSRRAALYYICKIFAAFRVCGFETFFFFFSCFGVDFFKADL